MRRTAVFVAERRARPGPPEPELPFLDPSRPSSSATRMHPAPKSREGLGDAESAAYSPEQRGSFALHWLAVDRSLLATDSAWTERGRTVAAPDLLDRPRRPRPAAARRRRRRCPCTPGRPATSGSGPPCARLFDAGLLHDLGPHGEPWHPTSSVRTVYRPGAPAMLKLSLGLRITNSRRENLRKELLRGAEVHRLLRAGLASRWHAAHPGFDIVRDPAWLACRRHRTASR